MRCVFKPTTAALAAFHKGLRCLFLSAEMRDEFLANPEKYASAAGNRRVRVSSILDWYGGDFGPTPQKALASLADYMPDEATKRLVASGDFSVSYLKYDWSLNKQ